MYCTDGSSNLGRPLHMLPHLMEVAQKNPNSFFLCKHEHFNEAPRETLQQIYQWLGEPNFEHDLTIYQNQTIMNMIQPIEH